MRLEMLGHLPVGQEKQYDDFYIYYFGNRLTREFSCVDLFLTCLNKGLEEVLPCVYSYWKQSFRGVGKLSYWHRLLKALFFPIQIRLLISVCIFQSLTRYPCYLFPVFIQEGTSLESQRVSSNLMRVVFKKLIYKRMYWPESATEKWHSRPVTTVIVKPMTLIFIFWKNQSWVLAGVCRKLILVHDSCFNDLLQDQ